MRAIVMLFTKATRGGSDQYFYPNIESVKITVEGLVIQTPYTAKDLLGKKCSRSAKGTSRTT